MSGFPVSVHGMIDTGSVSESDLKLIAGPVFNVALNTVMIVSTVVLDSVEVLVILNTLGVSC